MADLLDRDVDHQSADAQPADVDVAPLHEIAGSSGGDAGQRYVAPQTGIASIATTRREAESGGRTCTEARCRTAVAQPIAGDGEETDHFRCEARPPAVDLQTIEPATKSARRSQASSRLSPAPRSPETAPIPADEAGATGQQPIDTRIANAGRNKSKSRREEIDNLPNDAAAEVEGVHSLTGTPTSGDELDLRFNNPLVVEIVAMHRMRRRWMKARNSLILQGKAIGRSFADGDKEAGTAAFERVAAGKPDADDGTMVIALSPFLPAIERFDSEMSKIEKDLVKLAKKLPVADWVSGVRGFGFGSLAAIVGEAGDLSAYHTVSGVWKRLGLAVIDGDGRQRKVADAERALVHGYSPERRSVMWNAGGGLIGGMGLGPRPAVGEDVSLRDDLSVYQKLFIERLRYEADRDPQHRKPPVVNKKTGELRESFSKHAAARAKRYVEKRFLRDLTAEWRRVAGRNSARAVVEPILGPLGSDEFRDAAE